MSKRHPSVIACALATMLAWVISTALGEPVDPEVSCSNATSPSSVRTGSTGSLRNRSPTVSTVTPSPESSGAATRNGSDTSTARAPIIVITAAVSCDQRVRSVRGVG
ncbi:hypothetical protein MHAS44199_16185 [Mycolicibacterium hassiacum DSM 44199]|nr:hypothetical protein [Mycolicibacterium hassiacum DSM 44199]